MQEVQLRLRFCTVAKQIFQRQMQGGGSRLASLFLRLASFFYFLGVKFHKAIRKPFIKRLDFTSICVGNIIAGGSGKTSFVMKLARDLENRFKVFVHSKGYLSKKGALREPVSHVDGDEAYLMRQSLKKASVFVSKGRYSAAKAARDRSFDLVLFDDGLQNYELDYSLRVMMLNADCLWGRKRFLPAGYLRDEPKMAQSSDYVVVLGSGARAEVEKVCGKKVIELQYALQNVEQFKGKKVALFCGLGQSDAFVRSVRVHVKTIVLEKRLVDHEAMSAHQFHDFEAKAIKLGAELLICTAKDAVKVESLQTQLPLVVAKAQLDIVSGEDLYEKLLDDIQARVIKNRKYI